LADIAAVPLKKLLEEPTPSLLTRFQTGTHVKVDVEVSSVDCASAGWDWVAPESQAISSKIKRPIMEMIVRGKLVLVPFIGSSPLAVLGSARWGW